MAAYAIIKTGGKQIKVQVGEPIWVEKLEVEVGEKFSFTEILAYSDGTKLSYGKPLLPGEVVATVHKQGRKGMCGSGMKVSKSKKEESRDAEDGKKTTEGRDGGVTVETR